VVYAELSRVDAASRRFFVDQNSHLSHFLGNKDNPWRGV
jgi:hypothetical protein